MVREAIESLYIGECDIYEYDASKDPVTKITKHQPSKVVSNQPCKLSFQRITSANQTETADSVGITAKLFVSPDVVITEGSKIVVTQHGRTYEMKSSGKPAVFGSHQEIMLELFKGWS